MSRVVVAGAGLAGMTAALRLAEGGAQVTLVHYGIGGLQLGQGTVDILGYTPDPVVKLEEALPDFLKKNPKHPYALVSAEDIKAAGRYFQERLGAELLVGEVAKNEFLPTAVGALRPTGLYQPSMAAGILREDAEYLILGIKQLKDFYPKLIAQNLQRLRPGLKIRWSYLDFPARGLEADCSALNYARALDNPVTLQRFAEAVKEAAQGKEIIGLPAVLGLDDLNAWRKISELAGHELFEIPLAPPSVPGMRLDRKLHKLLDDAQIRVIKGSKVIGVAAADHKISEVYVGTAGRPTAISASALVLAVGGFESGSLWLDSAGKVREQILDLPLVNIPDEPFHGDYWGNPQPLFECGVAVDNQMRVLDGSDVVYQNLYVAGGILAAGTRWHDKSGEGIALVSAIKAADAILGGLA